MLKHVLAAVAIGCAALTFSAAGSPSSALSLPELQNADSGVTLVRRGHRGSRGHRGFRGHRAFRHGHQGFRHGRRFHGGIFIGPPLFHGYYYRGGCGWLRRRALVTGSPYWWRRYRLCRGW